MCVITGMIECINAERINPTRLLLPDTFSRLLSLKLILNLFSFA